MKMAHPISSTARFVGTVSLIPVGSQASSFQCYRRGSQWKSLWKKSPGLVLKPHRRLGQFTPNNRRSSMQVTYFQRDTNEISTYPASTYSNPSSISPPHLLHSLRAECRLRVTRDGICPTAHRCDSVPGSPQSGARIVPLTRPMRRTILAEFTREAAGDWPGKFFRE
jgi:hypothetical protein